ncbi:ferritin-like domain-containing protein [Synoicihabitans lomoniglobus]|uniref:Ferritin-like domain-containing protein n=1 Tax=Synoicihabitans lomoniglobus TaxID=2909285 RepID=A0AAE9ZVD8_9BACT|nr:ferritin-like domain-containing protein [Opitutaceae bacterium LMO-M01]WED64782.1 ferritin-like domain-containing protein [Opitutaceae bacterium LMO-M01]
MTKSPLITKLNDQLNREVSTFLRYMRQAAAIKGASNENVRSMYLAEVTDEVGHAQYLANQIAHLGGTPELAPDLSPIPATVDAMLTADIAAEGADVANYIELAHMAESAGHFALKQTMEDQAADEDHHRQEMARLRG